jgi:hypothetical protein
MRHRRSPYAVVLVLIVAAVASAPAVADAPSKVPVSGAITLVSNQDLSSSALGENTLVRSVAEVAFGGDMTGPATEHYQSLILANGTILQRGTGSFTGDVDGRTGTLTYVFHGDAATGGVITIIRGTGDLSGAHGRVAYGAASGSPPAFSYEGTITLP